MKLIALVVVLFSLPVIHAEEGIRKLLNEIKLDSVVRDRVLKKDQSVYHFQFKGTLDKTQTFVLDYSIDGKEFKHTLDNKLSFAIPLTYGKHKFQFYCHNESTDYEEIYTGDLESEALNHYYYSVTLVEAGEMIMVDKPVIYCYPLEKIDISIKLKVNGNLTFTYPEYKDSWNFTADETGKIELNGQSYNYLFWESSYRMAASLEQTKNGFCVAREDVLSFLEEKLTLIGFTSIEKADFITYWGPRMIQHKFATVRFMENEACNEFAELEISPKPDHVNRFYMFWSPSNSEIELIPQALTPINREGFTILEWGGQELPFYLF